MWKTAYTLIAIVLMLVTLGVVMLYSTSAVRAESVYHNPHYFVTRQAVWLLLAAIAGLTLSRIDYHLLKRVAVPLLAFTILLLATCLIPGIGLEINGSRRWLKIGPANFQPSELAKLASIIFLAWYLKRTERRADEFVRGLVIPGGVLGLVLGLIFVEPDFGTTMLLAAVGGLILFLGGTRLRYLVVAAAGGLALFTFAVMQDEVRMKRILAFLNPEGYAKDEAFQLLNALYAFVVGGVGGAGLGNSLQKRFFLPECHTDFILPIIAEELGVTGSVGVLLLFLGFCACGVIIAWRAPDAFGRLLAFGITMLITIQMLINVGVVTGCLPTKGLALPFISYGGSSLLVSGAMVGILVNIALHAGGVIEDDESRPIKDSLHSV